MSGKRPFILIVIIAGVLLLCGNMFVQSRLDDSIRKNKLIDEQFVEGAPPLVAFTTVPTFCGSGRFRFRMKENTSKWCSLPPGS